MAILCIGACRGARLHGLRNKNKIQWKPRKPRRTAERILEVTLDLFNRFGEPNVSTTLISAELHISPGNLYYHYPAKDELINALFDRYEKALERAAASRGQRRPTWRTRGCSST